MFDVGVSKNYSSSINIICVTETWSTDRDFKNNSKRGWHSNIFIEWYKIQNNRRPFCFWWRHRICYYWNRKQEVQRLQAFAFPVVTCKIKVKKKALGVKSEEGICTKLWLSSGLKVTVQNESPKQSLPKVTSETVVQENICVEVPF